MNIAMITGSPHRRGTSSLLADRFAAGAREAGHTVERFDAAFEDVEPCRACGYCRSHDGRCVCIDAMSKLRALLLEADMAVLVTPLYYFGMSAQLKRVIDRFFAFNGVLRSAPKRAALLATCGDAEEWVTEALEAHYKSVCRYLGWESAGHLFARGVYTREDIERTGYPERAYLFGKSLRQP